MVTNSIFLTEIHSNVLGEITWSSPLELSTLIFVTTNILVILVFLIFMVGVILVAIFKERIVVGTFVVALLGVSSRFFVFVFFERGRNVQVLTLNLG